MTDQQISPRVFIWHAETLTNVKQRITCGDQALKPAVDKLLREADAGLEYGPVSVMDKDKLPPSGDKHDYMSQGPYWWPNPDTPDGLPYVRRDGERNPEGDVLDSVRIGRLCRTVETLALAWYLIGDERYAEHAARLLHTWFLDEATRMNPHLEFGQAIPGICEGRGIGIIGTSNIFPGLVDALGLLETAEAWSVSGRSGLWCWMQTYLNWLLESEKGKDEAQQLNNHGTRYDVQIIALSLLTGRRDIAQATARKAREKRIASQIEPDGSQPYELRRTLSKHYSFANMMGMLDLASLAEHVGEDLWSFETSDGRGLRKALDWFLPYIDGEKEWGWEQIADFDTVSYIPLFRRAAVRYRDARYEAVLRKLPQETVATHRVNLTFPAFS